MSSSAMLTPPESGESPTIGPREGAGFTALNGSAHATNGNAAFTSTKTHEQQVSQQPNSIVEGVWNKLAAEASKSRYLSTLSGPAPTQAAHSTETKAAVQQQIANATQAAADRQISVQMAALVASFRSDDGIPEELPQPNNSISYRGLDYDGLRALRQYIYGEERGVSMDEEALLNQLERTWREGVRADYNRIIENIPVFIARERAFLTWVELKRHLSALLRANDRTSHPAGDLSSFHMLTSTQVGQPKATRPPKLSAAFNSTAHLWAAHKRSSPTLKTLAKASVSVPMSLWTAMSCCDKLSWY